MIDPMFFNLVSQISHFFFGSTVTLFTILFFGINPVPYVIALFVLATAVKEFWYDEQFENDETRGSGLLDFTTYQLGAFVALGLYLAKLHWNL